ncbi:hypothetical protein PLICRDRAFT_110588 [Plicaturopsis crispa FD-325 SS-3]|nr:hypothetical protein PLICRDRAFT_110588 [Plicaturopsis crispa FD-325 SS-3]
MSSYSTPSYGSGSSSSSNSGYSNCVQQCMASYPPPMATYMPSSTMNMTNSSSSGSGATHTVLVAPTQGVLRYVPFALNASVGDTVLFMWGANNHTVTKSSELTPCNKTTDGTAFASGTQNKPFSFTQVVNDTNTTFFYCGTPGHCQKGMFGIINPPNAAGAATSVSGMMSNMTSSSSDMAAMASYASMMTANSSQASSWGMNIDMASMPGWAQPLVAENVMYTQMFLAKNPDVLDASGNVNLAAGGSNPMMIPADVTSAVNNGGSSSSASTPAATTSASSSAASASGSASAAGAAAKSSGAGALASPSVLVGVVAVIATFFAL